jgi:hypothetical protein
MSVEQATRLNEPEASPKSLFEIACIKIRATIAEWRGRAGTVPESDAGGEFINEAIVDCKTELGIAVGALGDVWDDSWNGLTGPQIINKILDAIEAIGVEELVKSQGSLPDGDEEIIAKFRRQMEVLGLLEEVVGSWGNTEGANNESPGPGARMSAVGPLLGGSALNGSGVTTAAGPQNFALAA